MGRTRLALGAATAALLALVAANAAAPAADRPREQRAAAAIAGAVTRVRDGDTIVVGRTPVRLQGVAAPELRQPLGADARRYLRDLAEGRRVECEPDGTRSYDRIVAVCRLDGEDIGALLIRRGLARDCARYSKGRYAALEAAAGAPIRRLYELPSYCRRR
jgi:micrococcal nuclease